MDCSRKHVIVDDAGNCFSTKIAWKTTRRLQAAPSIVRVSLGDSHHREEFKMRFEGMLIILSRIYQLLNNLKFNSSVLVKDEEGRILLLTECASIIIFRRLVLNGREFKGKTLEPVHKYANESIRNLVLAYCGLGEGRYKGSDKIYEDKNSVAARWEKLIEEVSNKVERNLGGLGATAVEGKFLIGGPSCIEKIAQAGIEVWALAGDNMETAVNTGFYGRLIRQGTKQITVQLEILEIPALAKVGGKIVGSKPSRECVPCQVSASVQQLFATRGASQLAFPLVLDGKSLGYTLRDHMRNMFLEPENCSASVLCICNLLSLAAINTLMSILEILLKQVRFLSDGVLDHSSFSVKELTYLLRMVPIKQDNRDAKEQTIQDMWELAMGMLTPPFLTSKGLKILQVYNTTIIIGKRDFESLVFMQWDPRGHYYIGSLLLAFAFKIWDPGGSLAILY